MVDYLNELRESILDAFTGIVQGLPKENAVVNAHLRFMLEFIKTVGRDDDSNDNTICSCVALIGYVCYVFVFFRSLICRNERKCSNLCKKISVQLNSWRE